MGNNPRPRWDLVIELNRLLRLAGHDETAAMAAFHALSARHDRREIATALTAVTAEYLGTETATRYAHTHAPA
jgi:hypothetical protein